MGRAGAASPDFAVSRRRNFATLAQGASLLATAMFVPFLAGGPRSAHNLIQLFQSALLISCGAFAWCFLLAFWLHRAVARVERVDVMGATLRTSAAAIWFAPATILLASFSPLFLPAALLLVVNTTRLLYSQWQLVHGEDPPQAVLAPGQYGWEYVWLGAGELAGPVLPRHFAPALTVSIGFQAGALALLMRHPLLAAACFALAASVLTVFAISAGVWKAAGPPSLPRNIFGVALTIVLSAFVIVAGMARGNGGWGLGLGGGSGQIATPLHGPTLSTGSGTKASAERRELPPLPPDSPVAGSFPGVILWPEVQPVTLLIAPLPSSPGAFAAAGHPFSIPFAGEYWMFRFLYSHPPPGSFFRRGNPADLSFSTTDRWPLEMEAHQRLEKTLDLACCSAVQIEIRNADRFPNTVSLELSVIDRSARQPLAVSLGTQPVKSSPNLSATPVEPVGETLTFAVPPMRSLLFDEFEVSFHRLRVRADKSARIAIDRFVLLPHGTVVADPM